MRLVKRSIEISSAHRLVGYKGKCNQLHGHGFLVEIEIEGKPDEFGFILDFSKIKNYFEEYDHKVLLQDIKENRELNLPEEWIYWFSFNPTCENLANHWKNEIELKFLVKVKKLRVWETKDSSVIVYG